MLPSRYNVENLRRVLRDPRRLRTELEAIGYRIDRAAAARRHPPADAVDVAGADWDSLLVLDACRYDLFEAHSDLPGDLRKVESPGTQSLEFLRETFGDGPHHDTVYVSANPFTTRLEPDTFHRLIDLFDDAWDEAAGTVPPDAVVEAACEAHDEYPNKRLVVHFMQPHYPFLGPTGRRIDPGAMTGHVVGREQADEPTDSVWDRLAAGDPDLDRETVWRAYAENLDVVESEVRRLVECLDGKSVVTSDHGNLVGERLWPVPLRRYGHPGGLRVAELVEVPWLELPAEGRREVTADPPERTDRAESGTVERRLDRLGYA